MKMNRLTILAVCLCAAALPTAAQRFTLDSCRNMAIHNNKAVRMAEEGIKGAGYARQASKAAYLPGLDFAGSYMYNQRNIELLGENALLPTMSFDPSTGSYVYNAVTNPQTGQPVIDPSSGMPVPSQVAVIPKEAMSYDMHNVFFGAVTLTQPVYMGGQLRAMNEITKYAEKLAQSMRNSAVQEVVYAVDAAYWNVVSLQHKKVLAESYVSLIDTLRHNVSVMVREGVATRSDELKVEVKYNEAQLALTKVDNGLTLSRMALAQICGLPLDTGMELDDSNLAGSGGQPPLPETAMENVYAARPDLGSMRQGIQISQQEARLAKGDMLPKVAVVGAYSFSNPNVIHGFKKEFGGGFSVGATVAVPLWHWGANYNKYRVAQSKTRIQELMLADAEDKVQLQVSQARFSYEEARKRYDTTRANEKNADENLRQAQVGFLEGVLTTEDVIMAQTAWLGAHSETIDAEIGISLCRVYLSKVLGQMQY